MPDACRTSCLACCYPSSSSLPGSLCPHAAAVATVAAVWATEPSSWLNLQHLCPPPPSPSWSALSFPSPLSLVSPYPLFYLLSFLFFSSLLPLLSPMVCPFLFLFYLPPLFPLSFLLISPYCLYFLLLPLSSPSLSKLSPCSSITSPPLSLSLFILPPVFFLHPSILSLSSFSLPHLNSSITSHPFFLPSSSFSFTSFSSLFPSSFIPSLFSTPHPPCHLSPILPPIPLLLILLPSSYPSTPSPSLPHL